jgi:tetratricopeptide (TPR) repeat protein
MGQHFISYSRHDGPEFADWLYDELWRSAPSTQPWMDRRNLIDGFAFEEQIEDAISWSESVLFICSRDSAVSEECKKELKRADLLVKPIVPLQIHVDAEWPMAVLRLNVLDFTQDREWSNQLTDLRERLERIGSPEGRLGQNQVRLRRLQRAFRNAEESERPAIQLKIDTVQAAIDELLRHMAGQPPTAAATSAEAPTRVVWQPAALPPRPEFQDRKEEFEKLSRHLQDDGIRIVSVTGPEGIGKTSMVSRLLDDLESDGAGIGVDAVIRLTAHPGRPVTAPMFLEALRRRLPAEFMADREGSLVEPELPFRQKLDALLVKLGGTRIIVVIDGVETQLDPQTCHFKQADLDELLRFLATRRDHQVTVLLVSRIPPEPLLRELPGRAREIRIKAGLPREEAGALLRALDHDNRYGIADGNPAVLDEAYALTGGHPRALEALYGNLTLPDSPYRSLRQVLNAAGDVAPETALAFLVGQMFRHLDDSAWKVAQALSVFSQPVDRAAIEQLLQPYIGEQPIGSALDRLLQARLIRREGPLFYLPPPNDSRIFELVPKGPAADNEGAPPFTQTALLYRASVVFANSQSHDVRDVDDLSPRLSQIDLLIRGGEYIGALELIDEVDGHYLDRWGYSGILARQRQTLSDKLDDDWDRLVNLNALGRIHERGNNLPEAIACYRDALGLAKRLKRYDSEKKLYVNLAYVQMMSGLLQEARKDYERALHMARFYRRVDEEARPLAGLADYYARIGDFPLALQHAEKALTIARVYENTALSAELHWKIGRMHGQLGETVAAVQYLRCGLELAESDDNRPLEGKLHDAMAEVLIDQGRLARATAVAEKAVEIGEKINSPKLLREAGFTLALARLCLGELHAAEAVAERGSAYRRPGQTPSLLALRGIILLQQGRVAEAEGLFTATMGEVHLRRDNERRRRVKDYALIDLEGMARCGLAVSIGQWNGLDQAVRAFQEARQITSATGIVLRVMRLLWELEDIGGPGTLTKALTAASGGAALPPVRLNGSRVT